MDQPQPQEAAGDPQRVKLKRIERSRSLPIAPTRRILSSTDQEPEERMGESSTLDQEASIKFMCKAFKIVTVLEKRKVEKELQNLSQLLGGQPLALRLAIGYIGRGQFLTEIQPELLKERMLEFLDIYKVSIFSGNLRTVRLTPGQKKEMKGGEEKFLNWTTIESTSKCPQNELVQFIASGILKNWFIDKNRAEIVSQERRDKIVQLVKGYLESFLRSDTRVNFGYTNHTANWMFLVACKLQVDEEKLISSIVDTVRVRMDVHDEFDWFTYLHRMAFASLWPSKDLSGQQKEEEDSKLMNAETVTNYRLHRLFLERDAATHILTNILSLVEKRSRKFSTLSTVEDKYLDWILSLMGHGKDLDCVDLLLGNEEFMTALRRTSVVVKRVADANLGVKELEALHKILLIWFALVTSGGQMDMKDEILFEGVNSSLRSYQQTVKRYKAVKDEENLLNIWPVVADKCHILIRFITSVDESKKGPSALVFDLCQGILRIVEEGYL